MRSSRTVANVFGPAAGPSNPAFLTAPVTATGDQRIDGILGINRWAGPVTFGDPSSAGGYEPDHPEPLNDFTQLDVQQLAAVRTALTGSGPADRGFSISGFTDLAISYGGPEAEIRIANTSDPKTAYTYMPDEAPWGGDVFFGKSGKSPVVGNYHYMTVLHELGHAMGLEHGNEAGSFGALPTEEDSMEFSLMTYRSYIGADPANLHNGTWSYAQSYMIDDIAALQALYGADFTTSARDSRYAWDPDSGAISVDGAVARAPGENRIFLTIWDGGGIDTYDLSAYGNDLELSLAPGGHSTFAEGQLAWLGGGPNGGAARGNVFNARLYQDDPRSLIENAIGGSGDDRITGNSAGNRLDGGAGADRMAGGAGDDWYVVDDPGDTVRERRGNGIDTVAATIDFKLGANLDNLVLTGWAGKGVGNRYDNRITGTDGGDTLIGRGGDDHLVGGKGADVLAGGAGADVFCFGGIGDSARRAPDVLRHGGAPAFEGAGAGWGDRIDMGGIDADPLRDGNQDFVFGGPHAAGHVWLCNRQGDTVVRASAGSDGGFKLVIEDGGVRAEAYGVEDFLGVG